MTEPRQRVSPTQTHRDPALGFELDIPVGATVLDRSQLGVVIEVAGAGGADPARVVLTVEPAEDDPQRYL